MTKDRTVNPRVDALRRLPRDRLEAEARKVCVSFKPSDTNVKIARAIELREFHDLRAAQKREHIKDIF